MKKLLYIILEFLLLFGLAILILAFYNGNFNIACWSEDIKYAAIFFPAFVTFLRNL